MANGKGSLENRSMGATEHSRDPSGHYSGGLKSLRPIRLRTPSPQSTREPLKATGQQKAENKRTRKDLLCKREPGEN